jgi:hypothetical protein
MANVWIALMQVCPTGEAPELTASGGLILLVGGGLLAGFVFYANRRGSASSSDVESE